MLSYTDCCIPMGTNYAPFIAEIPLVCYEKKFMASFSDDKK